MSKDYVVRLYFADGTHEQVKYETSDEANEAFEDICDNVDKEVKRGELALPDGTRFAFKLSGLSHWKVFKYTAPDNRD